MNISEIRKSNVKRIIDIDFDGNVAAFSKSIGKQESQIHRIFNNGPHGRNIGSSLARTIENKLGKPKDSLDQGVPVKKSNQNNIKSKKTELQLSDDEEYVLNTFKNLDLKKRELILLLMDKLNNKEELKENDPVIILGL